MTDNKPTGDKTLSVSTTKTLTLKRPIEQGTVRQSFSHGRSKAVVVETVKRRQGFPGGPQGGEAPPQQSRPPQSGQQQRRPNPTNNSRTLSADEQSARHAALLEAKRRDEEQRRVSEARSGPGESHAPAVAIAPAPEPQSQLQPQSSEQAAPARQPEPSVASAAPVAEAPRPDPVAAPAPAESRAPAAPVAAPTATPAQPSAPRAPVPDRSAPSEMRAPRPAGSGDRPGFDNRGPRPEGDRGPRPAGYGDRSGYADRGPRPGGYGDRSGPGDRGPRPAGAGDRPPYEARGPRPEGDRGPRPGYSADRGPRPEGDRGPRPGGYGDRPSYAGDRGPRPSTGFSGDRPPRPAGAGPARYGFSRPGGLDGVAGALDGRSAPRPPGVGRARTGGDDLDTLRPARRTVGGAAPRAATPAAKTPSEKRTTEDPNRRGRLTVTNAFNEGEERTRSVAAFRRRVQRLKGGGDEQKEKIYREVIIPETITIQELANRMSERGVDIIRMLMKQGAMHKITDVIDADTAQLIAEELGHTVKRVAESDVEEGLFEAPDTEDALESRPPVVTIMGHVDHGKTSLLDAIRKANVVSGEAGGITQHIGAYQVVSPLGGKITFIDTPGHAAFTAMRARGAKVTDIVVLVVAANDSVMPQTIEAINHAKAAKVPMIVAINKVDLPDAKAERVKSDLLQHNVQVETMGGETLEVEVSAKTGFNLDKLLENIQLQAEVLDLRANPNRAAEGSVVEAKLDRGRGPVATVLVQRGTLRQGDIVVAGSEWGRVRALIDDKNEHLESAGPSVPVEVLGFNGTPEAGDRVAVVESEARAREITEYRERQKRDQAAARGAGATRSLADMMSQLKSSGRKEFPLVVKGDVQGSVEAILGALEKLGTEEVIARVMHAGVGGITESDVTLAQAAGASILGFNIRAHKEAREAAERAGVEIRYYNIIYDLVDDIKAAMSGLLAPTLREQMLGNAEILEVFNITKVGNVAGCRVTDGRVERGANVRLIRDRVVIHEGTLSTLKRFKDEVKEVQVGQECGMAFERYEDLKKGDIIECYRVESVKRSL